MPDHTDRAQRLLDRVLRLLPWATPAVAVAVVPLLGLHARARDILQRDGGSYTAETVLVAALLISIALTAIAALGSKVMDKVGSISFG